MNIHVYLALYRLLYNINCDTMEVRTTSNMKGSFDL